VLFQHPEQNFIFALFVGVFAMSLNPWVTRHPAMALVAGNIVISYGEIELRVGMCLGNALGDQDTALRTMFRILGETARIGAADALMRGKFKAVGLANEYADIMGAVRYCVVLRNHYAHCHWADDINAGVFFTRLDDPAKASESFAYTWKHIDLSLLTAQWAFMQYAADGLDFLNFEYLLRIGKKRHNAFPMPAKLSQPKPHNPLGEHVPPWLNQADRQRHIEHARELESDGQKQKPKLRPRKPSQREKREARLRSGG
jgi:hypothetical protein